MSTCRRPMGVTGFVAAALTWWMVGWTAAATAPWRVLPEGEMPSDVRLGTLKTLDDEFPFHPPATLAAWEERAEFVRRQILVANGLWPMPTPTPANAVVHGLVDRGDYTVERVYLESFPGHFVTGSLYRPKGFEGRRPAVLSPHGHWADGRFHDDGPDAVRWAIVRGAERFEVGGRHPLQARCVQLARMGCIVFLYDMIGYADSLQLDHRAGVREEMNTAEDWGFFSPQAELRLQNTMGLQTYNTIRAFDWLAGLDDVDPERMAVTGASGGGTQTFILSAIDPRPAVSFPAVMVSTAMQGGCTCENASYLRVDTGNIEFAALFAPRPLGMTAADDWTREIETKGMPALRQLFGLYGAEEQVMARTLAHFPHNYNYVSRSVMYHWLNRHLGLGFEEPIVEEDFRPLSIEEATVWTAAHPRPPSGPDHERSLLRWITEDSDRQMAALVPQDASEWERYREVVGGAVEVMIGRGVPPAEAIEVAEAGQARSDGFVVEPFLVRHGARQEEVPALRLRPSSPNSAEAPPGREGAPARTVVVWITMEGKRGLFQGEGALQPGVRRLLDEGLTVVGVDLFGQGEFTEDGVPMEQQPLNDSGQGAWSSYAGYTFGYNPPLFVRRVHDVLTAVAAARSEPQPAERVYLVGLAGAGRFVAAAAAVAEGCVDRIAADTAGFRFAALTEIDDADFLPGGAKYLDLPGIAALAAPTAMWLAGEGNSAPAILAAAYAAVPPGEGEQAGKGLTLFDGPSAARQEAAVEWLLSP